MGEAVLWMIRLAIVLLPALSMPWANAAAKTTGAKTPKAEDSWKADPPGQWRKLGWDEATTTSTCIGKSISPICAVENKLACYMQIREELCHLAIRDHEGRKFVHSTTASHALYIGYRISAVRRVKAGQKIVILDDAAQPGDYLIDLRFVSCEVATNECENDIGPATTHLVRKFGDEWRIVTWDTPRW